MHPVRCPVSAAPARACWAERHRILRDLTISSPEFVTSMLHPIPKSAILHYVHITAGCIDGASTPLPPDTLPTHRSPVLHPHRSTYEAMTDMSTDGDETPNNQSDSSHGSSHRSPGRRGAEVKPTTGDGAIISEDGVQLSVGNPPKDELPRAIDDAIKELQDVLERLNMAQSAATGAEPLLDAMDRIDTDRTLDTNASSTGSGRARSILRGISRTLKITAERIERVSSNS